MTFVTKPKVHHPNLPTNEIGLTRRDYECSISTLCLLYTSDAADE